MPHIQPPPPPPPPPPYPPPSPPDVSMKIEATFGMAIAGICLLSVIMLCLGAILAKLATAKAAPAESTNVSSTPKTADAVESASVKVDAPAGAPLVAKLGHALSIIVAGVIAVAVAIVLADGTSVIKLKDARYLPIITNPELKDIGFDHRADELLGSTYGVGLNHDQSGARWTDMRAGSSAADLIRNLGLPVIAAALPSVIATDDLKHPVSFLECDDLLMAGLCAMSFGYIAEVVAVVMLVFHVLSLAGLVPAKPGKMLASLVWLVLAAGFLIVILLAIGIFYSTWTCGQTIIPSIRLADHFQYSYGFPFAVTGFLSALLIFLVNLTFTSTKDGEPGQPAPALGGIVMKVAGGLTAGVVTAAALAFVVMGSNDVFAPPAPVDPNVNPCAGQKPYHAGPNDHYFSNTECMRDSITQVLEQAGANVTRGYRGDLDAGNRVPILEHYDQTDLCPVNVHWHLGAEHYSYGQFDSRGSGPHGTGHRRLASDSGSVRLGFQCHHYDSHDPKFTTEYNWQHCTHMEVGETYEIHWPHSAAGACGTEWQYQTPFYDGVFCRDGIITIAPLNTYEKIGVQAQIFTVVNDESYYIPNLIDGMIVEGDKGADIAKYTGSTTGTSRDNQICSRYTPVTWQVDRKCHMVSASSFDKLCQDMKGKRDDMSGDLHPHGARELVADAFVANNQQSRKK